MEKKSPSLMLQIRVNDRLRYLLNLASAATGMTITDFACEAMEARLSEVTLYKREPVDLVYGETPRDWPELYDEEEECVKREQMKLVNLDKLLWSESNITRMQMLDLIAPHLMPADDRALLAFAGTLDEYKIVQGNGYKLDREKIDANWPAIQKQFAAHQKPAKKGIK